MDFELLKKIVSELAPQLAGARVAKIHQPAAELFIFRLWTGEENLRLLISTSAQDSRLHLTQDSYPNPAAPPRFCQLLRARITRIHSISMQADDRVVSLQCSGPKGEVCLVVELTGRSSNMILVDDCNRIIDALKRFSGHEYRRQIAPGNDYVLPQQQGRAAGHDNAQVLPGFEGRTLNQVVDDFYRNEQFVESKTDLVGQLRTAIVARKKKLQRRVKNISAELAQQQNAESFKQIGELILANLHTIKKGDTHIELVNYYQEPQGLLEVSLDASLSPQENAANYFKRYKKAHRGVVHSERRLEESQEELAWLETLEYQLNDGATVAELEEIATECRQAGLLRGDDRFAKKSPNKPVSSREAISPSGYQIRWGRNNKQNDNLTKSMTRGDLWLHAHNIPGAHVVLKGAGEIDDVPQEDLLYTAAIAAGYSKARHDSKVEVMIASWKQVKKPKSSRPGLVTVVQFQTVLVKPIRLE